MVHNVAECIGCIVKAPLLLMNRHYASNNPSSVIVSRDNEELPVVKLFAINGFYIMWYSAGWA